MAKKEIKLNYLEDSNLFDTTAQRWAEDIEESQCKNKKDQMVKMKTKKTQLRNFYDKVLELEKRSHKEEWNEVLPFVKMLNSKVAYAHNREVINCEFQTMINQCISQIRNKDDLKTFKLFFEAVLGFFKGSN